MRPRPASIPRCSGIAAFLCAGALGCKEPNPDFVGDTGGASSDGSSTTTTTTVGGTSTTSVDESSSTSAVDDGSSGSVTSGASADGSSGTGGACEDIDGDNMMPADATDLGDQDCDAGPDQVAAVVVDESDEDWFTFHGNYVDDATCGSDDPFVSLSVGDAGLTVSAWLVCDVGTAEVLDCGTGMSMMAPMGQPGCCNVGAVDITFNCMGESDESATVGVQVSSTDPVDCVAYDLGWDFDA